MIVRHEHQGNFVCFKHAVALANLDNDITLTVEDDYSSAEEEENDMRISYCNVCSMGIKDYIEEVET